MEKCNHAVQNQWVRLCTVFRRLNQNVHKSNTEPFYKFSLKAGRWEWHQILLCFLENQAPGDFPVGI